MTKKTVHWTIDEEIIERIKAECNDLIPESRFANNILRIVLSQSDEISLLFEQYRKTHGNRPVPVVLEELLRYALDEKKKDRN